MYQRKRLFQVKHFWGEEDWSSYLVTSTEVPTVEQVVEVCTIDYEPDKGESIEIEEATIYQIEAATNLEIEKNLVVSSCHITEEDDKLLGSISDSSVLSVDRHRYGFLAHIPGEPSDVKDVLGKLPGEGFSESFVALMAKAFRVKAEEGVSFLKIDCDGPVVEGLDVHEW